MAKKPQAKAYRSARDTFSTGDIVLFSGKGGISAGIKWATVSRWSHVGMVLVLPEYDFVCLWESTTLSDIKDLETGEGRMGVQLVPLSVRMQQYDGEIAVRHLRGVTLDKPELKALMRLRKQLSRRPYERSQAELIKAALDGTFGPVNKEDLSSLFCSELVAEAYQALGLIRDEREKPSNEYTPADFSADQEEIPWVRGSLGREVFLRGGKA